MNITSNKITELRAVFDIGGGKELVQTGIWILDSASIAHIKEMMSNGVEIAGYGRLMPTKVEFDLQDAEVNDD